MGGPGNPPQGTPDGAPGGDDEYGSVVFDESFVRAARLQEFSAEERITEHTPAVRRTPSPRRRGTSWQALTLVVVIAAAFATAVYLGVRQPYERLAAPRAGPLRMTVVPLAPAGEVPGGVPADLYARSPAARFATGSAGITLPAARRTGNFSDGQVMTALTIAKDYLVESSLDPAVLTGGVVRSVRVMVDSGQLEQFDRSFERPAGDGLHSATGWLVRFDPAHTALAEPRVRVQGALGVSATDPDVLEITSDHTFVYAVRPARGGPADASLFTVRRELLFRFDHDDLRRHQTELVTSSVQAGPLACATGWAKHLRPLLAGARPGGTPPKATDLYAGDGVAHPCGTLAAKAQPKPSRAG
ncbi:SCO2583 family membrane protein [Streptomyces sp. JNUCC 64]